MTDANAPRDSHGSGESPAAAPAARRKANQRERIRAALFAQTTDLRTIPTTGLAEGLPALIGDPEYRQRLGAVLHELGRRGGVHVCLLVPKEFKP